MSEVYSPLPFAPSDLVSTVSTVSTPCLSGRKSRGGSRRFFAGTLAGRYDPARSERSNRERRCDERGRPGEESRRRSGDACGGGERRRLGDRARDRSRARPPRLRPGAARPAPGAARGDAGGGRPARVARRAGAGLGGPRRRGGGGGRALACDVRDAAAVGRAAAAVEARWGAAEVVVPAAGAAYIRPFAELPAEQFAATLETHLTGAFLLLQALLPGMRRRGGGWIFAVLSVAARRGFPGWAAYCASKWGLAGLLAALREELAGSGVRLTALYPGATDTPIWQGIPGDWNRAVMMPPAEVARALGCALDADPRTLVEEIHLGPAGGAL